VVTGWPGPEVGDDPVRALGVAVVVDEHLVGSGDRGGNVVMDPAESEDLLARMEPAFLQ
jgi:hypothetical protein